MTWLDITTAFSTIIASLGAFSMSIYNAFKTQEVHVMVNSRMDEFKKLIAKEAKEE